jgi:hypothetical protein
MNYNSCINHLACATNQHQWDMAIKHYRRLILTWFCMCDSYDPMIPRTKHGVKTDQTTNAIIHGYIRYHMARNTPLAKIWINRAWNEFMKGE